MTVLTGDARHAAGQTFFLVAIGRGEGLAGWNRW
jgi:hypothetical protein